MGTPGFAPPEQYSHVYGPGPWTDVYGFGALLHFLLTGDYPAEKIFFFREIRPCSKSGRQWSVGERVFRRRQLRIMNQLVLECTIESLKRDGLPGEGSVGCCMLLIKMLPEEGGYF